jgi:hypothetical protein
MLCNTQLGCLLCQNVWIVVMGLRQLQQRTALATHLFLLTVTSYCAYLLPTVQVATWQSSHPSGLEVFYFPSGQVEGHHAAGSKDIVFPDGSIRRVMPDG